MKSRKKTPQEFVRCDIQYRQNIYLLIFSTQLQNAFEENEQKCSEYLNKPNQKSNQTQHWGH
jgi:hypothetical protein